jgi:hypothetical protein
MTGHKPIDQPIAEVRPSYRRVSPALPALLTRLCPSRHIRVSQQKAQASAASAAAAGGAHPSGHFGGEESVESQILRLAGSLGVKCVPVTSGSQQPLAERSC